MLFCLSLTKHDIPQLFEQSMHKLSRIKKLKYLNGHGHSTQNEWYIFFNANTTQYTSRTIFDIIFLIC